MAEPKLTLTTAISYFEEAEELSQDARATAERCRDYYDNKQWTAVEEAALRKRKQPASVRNRIKPKVDYLKGLEAQTRTDPKAFPRTPGDDDAASAATDAIRFVCDQSSFASTRSDCFENLTVEGVCGVEVYVVPNKRGDYDIKIDRFAWDRIGYDPHSRQKDFSDALYRYGVTWMDYDQALRRYPDGEEALQGTISKEGQFSTTYDDAPRVRWADFRRKRVRVVKLEWKEDDTVYVCEFTRGGFLVKPEPSPFLDENGDPEWSIILQSAHVDRDGARYGWVKAWLDVQDEINKRASKYLHLVTMRQTYSTKGAGGDINAIKRELAKPDGHLQLESGEYGKDFGILPTMDQAAAQFQLLQEAKQEIDSVGVNAALAGADSRDLSGKAIGRLQQGGSTEIKPLLDALGQFNVRIYRAVWNRIKQYWTAEKWIRVTDDENNLKWVGLNQKITLGQQLQEEYGELPPEYANDPRLSQVVETKNNVTEIDVDIILDEVPDTVTVQQEQFEALTQIFPAIPDPQKPAALELLIEASSIRNKGKFLEKLQGAGQQDPAAAQAQQAQQEIQQIQMQAQMDKLNSEIEKNHAAAELNLAKAESMGHNDALNIHQTMSQPKTLQSAISVEARASGGPVEAGKPYLVGELGPELIVPSASGAVVPNSQLSDADVIQQIKQTPWYQEFVQNYKEEPNWHDPNYDYFTAWRNGVKPNTRNPHDGRYHWPSALPSGQMLKGANHPTAWMEYFMRETGKDPQDLGLNTAEEGTRYLDAYRKRGM